MVTIKKEGDNFIFEVKGIHKLWAFKSQISIPADHIVRVHQDYDTIKGWKGFRMPGTHIPFVFTAGTFYKDGEKIFWDVLNMDKCIIVELKDTEYKQLIIEVEDIAEAIKILTA
jgi:hypothetical protein